MLYCNVVIYGFMLDEKGMKMFKFFGNIIVFEEVIK